MTRMPKVVEIARSLIGKEPHKGVNPMKRCHWRGHSSGVLKGDVKDCCLLDGPAPRDWKPAGGVADADDSAATLRSRRVIADFSTYSDIQARVEIKVLQRRSGAFARQQKLGTSILMEFRRRRAAFRKIEVTFDITANAFFTYRRKNLARQEQKISITGSSGLSTRRDREVQREAEATPMKTRRQRKRSRSRTTPITLLIIREAVEGVSATRFPADKKKQGGNAIAAVREANRKNDTEASETSLR